MSNVVNTNPIVSIVMPCYNASRFIREAIDSVRSQSYQNWELLIVDDGSTDSSCKIAQEYVELDSRIYLIEQPNSGACSARNNGIKHARGEYVKFLDADDILCPDCLEEQVRQISTLKPNQIPFGNYGHIDANGDVISTYCYSKDHLTALKGDQIYAMFCYWQILISAPLHRRELLTEVGGFDVDLPRHQETFFHFCLALADVQFVYYQTFTFYYREYTSTYRITSNYRSGKIKEDVLRREIYIPKQEALLLNKYRVMPSIYRPFFTQAYFDRARYYFAHKQPDEGQKCFNKVVEYGALSTFMRFYMSVGKIFGYVNIESVFQMRLKILGKL